MVVYEDEIIRIYWKNFALRPLRRGWNVDSVYVDSPSGYFTVSKNKKFEKDNTIQLKELGINAYMDVYIKYRRLYQNFTRLRILNC